MLRSYVLGLLFLREVACKTTSVDPAVASGESTVTGTAILRSTDANNLDAATITSAAAFERADWNIWRTTCWVSKACTVYCEADDRACWETASSIIQTCAPSWSSSIAVLSESSAPGGTEWTSYLTTMGWSGVPESTTLSIYTSFSTANETFRKQGLSSEPYTTITPVYAIGPPIESVSVTNMSDGPATTYRTAPTPGCKFGAVSTWNSSYCGGCTITGGTVELYYWPASTAILGGDEQIASTTMTAELNGTVLQSPSVYIYLHTIYAKDACGTVGRPHFGSIIAMNAEEISTIVHIGGKVAAYETGALDYGILTGSLPPASDYQMLPTCIMFGCKTMLPTVWSPTLVVPSKLRTVDTSWAHCEMHLAGLMDPPKALQGRQAAASATMPQAPETPVATPCQTLRPVPQTPSSPTQYLTDSGLHRSSATSDHESTSTSTVKSTIWANVVTRTLPPNYGDIDDYLESINGDDGPETDTQSGHREHQSVTSESEIPPAGPPDDFLRPRPLSDDDGVVVKGTTLAMSEAMTIGSEGDRTTLSLDMVNTNTVLLYGTSAAGLVTEPAPNTPNIQHASGGGYRIGRHTIAAGSAVTVGKGSKKVTYSVMTKESETFLAVGAITTVRLINSSHTTIPPMLTDLSISQAINQNFLVNGTILLPGESVTVGSGSDRTTVLVTSVQGVPVIVVDGTLTQEVTHTATRETNTSLPAITQESASTPIRESTQWSVGSATPTVDSGTASRSYSNCSSVLMALVAFFGWTAF